MKLYTKILLTLLVIALPGAVEAATLSVSPASQSVKVGDKLTVTVRLDTQGTSIDGVDFHLSFDPGVIVVEDANTSQSGIQIGAEALMPTTLLNKADNSLGQISFSQVVNMGSKYKGSGVLATITFKAKAAGTSGLKFAYKPKDTTDSNIAAGGVDVLDTVVNGSYTVTGKGAVVKPTAAPNQTVTNPGTPLQDPGLAPLPEGDATPFEFSEKKGFWQIVWEMITGFFGSFKNRATSAF